MNSEPLRLLILDDEEGHIELVRRAFDEAGSKAEIRSAGTLREYRALAAAQPPDIALLDLNLPDGSGAELLSYPPQAAPFPVLVMTAYGNTQIVVEVMKAGALDYVVKSPEAFAAMPHTVESALREWALLQKHKRAEATLIVSDGKFRTIVETTNDIIWEVDRNGFYTYISPRVTAILGYSPEEMMGKSLADFISPQEVERLGPLLDELTKSGRPVLNLEYVNLHKDGRLITMETNGVPFYDAEGKLLGYRGIDRDITERRLAEASAEESKALLQSAINIMPVGLWIFDAEGKIVTSSAAAQRIWAGARYVGVDQLGEYKGWRTDSGKPIGAHEWAGARAFEKGETSIEEEVEIECFDGMHKTILDSAVPLRKSDGSIGGAITINQDITERKRAETALVEREERFRRISKVTSDIAYSCSTSENSGFSIEWMMGAADRITGYTHEEIKAHGCWRFLVVEEDLTLFDTNVTGLAPGSKGACELRIRHKNGDIIWLSSFTECFSDTQTPGRLILYGSLSDISDRKHAEEVLQSEQRMLARTEGIANIGSWKWDIATDTVTWSDALFRIFQRDPREGAPSFAEHPAFYHPDDMARLNQAVKTAVASGTSYELELRAIRKDGETRLCVARGAVELAPDGSPARLYGSLQDITERKKAGDTLRAYADRHKTILLTAMDGYWLVSAQGRLLEVNDTYCRMSGYSAQELLTMSIPELEAAEAGRDTAAHIQKIIAQGSDRFESRHRRKDGSLFDVEASVTYLTADGGRFVVFLRDITKRKQAEAALRESEQIFREFMEHSPIHIFFKDEQLRSLHLSRNFETMLGRPLAELLGKSTAELFPSDIARSIVAADKSILEGGKDIFCEEEFNGRTYETTKFPITIEGKPRYLAGYSIDITERKKSESDILEAYEMQGILNAMLKNSLTSLPLEKKLADHLAALLSIPWLNMQSKGAIFLANGKNLDLTVQQGLAPELLVSCAKVPFGKCLCGRAAKSGKVVASTQVGPEHETVYEGMPPHGHYCVPIIAAGATLGVLDLFLKEGTALTAKQTDFVRAVADNLAADILQARVKGQFIQAQKLEAVGLLAGGVAHDFNNMLTAIICYGGFLMKELAADDPKRGDVKEILAAADRAAGLTTQLLTFSRKQILSLKIVDLNASVGGMVKMLTRLIGEDVRLETRLAARSCPVKVDTGQMDQMIVNLAVNARDAMPKGGALVLETAIVTPGEDFFYKHAELPRGPLVCLSVSDTGIGMSEEVKEHLFEPFFTTKDKGKGTGLGLATVFGIVKQSGGEIEVESELGRGTTLKIYLPHIEADIPDTDEDKDQGVFLKGTETVLLVEDEDSLRRLGERLLLMSGYTVISAAGGKEALEAAERHGRPVDLLLTDVVMPGMSGRELALELARRKLARRTLYMSGYTDDAIVRHGVLEPGLAFIYKPFTVEALSAKLRQVLDGPADQAKP